MGFSKMKKTLASRTPKIKDACENRGFKRENDEKELTERCHNIMDDLDIIPMRQKFLIMEELLRIRIEFKIRNEVLVLYFVLDIYFILNAFVIV